MPLLPRRCFGVVPLFLAICLCVFTATGVAQLRPDAPKPMPKTVDYERLQEARSLSDLPEAFRKAFVDGDATCVTNILYSRGMPADLLSEMTRRILPEGKITDMMNRVVKNGGFRGVADPYYAHMSKGRHLRYLIFPTHILQLIRFYGGVPHEDWFYLSLTEDGVKVIGVKYTDIIDSADQSRSSGDTTIEHAVEAVGDGPEEQESGSSH